MDKQNCDLKLASYAFTTEDISKAVPSPPNLTVTVYSWKKDAPLQFHPMLNTSLPCFVIKDANVGKLPPPVRIRSFDLQVTVAV